MPATHEKVDFLHRRGWRMRKGTVGNNQQIYVIFHVTAFQEKAALQAFIGWSAKETVDLAFSVLDNLDTPANTPHYNATQEH